MQPVGGGSGSCSSGARPFLLWWRSWLAGGPYEKMRMAWLGGMVHTGHARSWLGFSTMRLAHSIQKRLCPHGTRAATTSESMHIRHRRRTPGEEELGLTEWLLKQRGENQYSYHSMHTLHQLIESFSIL